jgi:hypothetical protein
MTQPRDTSIKARLTFVARLGFLGAAAATALATMSWYAGNGFLFGVNAGLLVILSAICLTNYRMAGKL